MKVIDFSPKSTTVQLRYKAKVCPVIDGNEVYDEVAIVLINVATGQILEICPYSEFLYEHNLLNRDKNTKVGYAKSIAMFLNYLFFDRDTFQMLSRDKKINNLDRIENLTIEDGNSFLSNYKNGKVGGKYVKKQDSNDILARKLTKFYYYLFKNYHMKNLKQTDFNYEKRITKRFGKNTEITCLKCLFKIRNTQVPGRNRLEFISFYALSELIALAIQNYPMIALGIALQAFAGLRIGEVCNVTYFNSQCEYIGYDLKNWHVDLRIKPQLRSDGVDPGQIKSPGIAYVHPVFIPYFNLLLLEHKNYIEKTYKRQNIFGAIFMNRDGKAMTKESYERYFNKLISMLPGKLLETQLVDVQIEAKRILTSNFTSHTLRYFFTQYISKLPDTTVFDIAMFRRDRSLDSAMTYMRNNPYLIDNKIKEIQDNAMKKQGLY